MAVLLDVFRSGSTTVFPQLQDDGNGFCVVIMCETPRRMNACTYGVESNGSAGRPMTLLCPGVSTAPGLSTSQFPTEQPPLNRCSKVLPE
jgi:hypothetical protein